MRRGLSSPMQWSFPRAGETHCSDERAWSQKRHREVCAPHGREKSNIGFLIWVWQPAGAGAKQRDLWSQAVLLFCCQCLR